MAVLIWLGVSSYQFTLTRWKGPLVKSSKYRFKVETDAMYEDWISINEMAKS